MCRCTQFAWPSTWPHAGSRTHEHRAAERADLTFPQVAPSSLALVVNQWRKNKVSGYVQCSQNRGGFRKVHPAKLKLLPTNSPPLTRGFPRGPLSFLLRRDRVPIPGEKNSSTAFSRGLTGRIPTIGPSCDKSVLGSGGLGASVVWRYGSRQNVEKIWCAPGNAGCPQTLNAFRAASPRVDAMGLGGGSA